MPLRTTIEPTADGQLKIERQARVGVSGNAHQRKKQQKAGIQETWRTAERVIAKDLNHIPIKAKGWPAFYDMESGNLENQRIAEQNQEVADEYASAASITVAQIETAAHNFAPAPPKRVRTILEEY